MIFGKERDKGLRINGHEAGGRRDRQDGITEADLLVHDETRDDPTIAFMLSRMDYPEYPVPVGVFRAVQRPTYDDADDAADRAGDRRPRARAICARSSSKATPGRSSSGEATMICPECRYDNIEGVDRCENCGQDLCSLDQPASTGGAARPGFIYRAAGGAPGAVAGARRDDGPRRARRAADAELRHRLRAGDERHAPGGDHHAVGHPAQSRGPERGPQRGDVRRR